MTSHLTWSLSHVYDDKDWGIDTVHLYYPCNPDTFDQSSLAWQMKSRPDLNNPGQFFTTYNSNFKVGGGTVAIHITDPAWNVHLVFNAARVADLPKPDLLHPDAYAVLVEHVIRSAQTYVEARFLPSSRYSATEPFPSNWLHEVKHRRMDVSRNIYVRPTDLRLLGRAWERLVPRYQSERLMYGMVPKDRWSMYHFTKNVGRDVAYVKSKEMREDWRKDAGWHLVRFEAQLRDARLDKWGLDRLAGVHASSVWGALNWRFESGGWSRPFPANNALQDALKHMSGTERRKVIGYLFESDLGLDSGLTRSQQRTLERHVAGSNLAVIDGQLVGGEPMSADLMLGTVGFDEDPWWVSDDAA